MKNKIFLDFTVRQMEIKRIDKIKIYAQNKNYAHARFSFSGDWDGEDIFALFVRQKQTPVRVPILQNTCQIPNELLASAGHIKILVYSGDRKVSSSSEIIVLNSDFALGNPPAPIVSGHEYVMTADGRNRYIKLTENTLQYSSNGEEWETILTTQGDTGEKGDTGAKGETGEKGDTGAKGETGIAGKDVDLTEHEADSSAHSQLLKGLPTQETGTWQPIVKFGAQVMKPTGLVATYVKTGNLCYLSLSWQTLDAITDTGSLQITGLPFTAKYTSTGITHTTASYPINVLVSAGALKMYTIGLELASKTHGAFTIMRMGVTYQV